MEKDKLDDMLEEINIISEKYSKVDVEALPINLQVELAKSGIEMLRAKNQYTNAALKLMSVMKTAIVVDGVMKESKK